MYVTPVAPQPRIVHLLELKLVKEVRHSSVHGQGGRKTRVAKDCIQKDINRSPGVLESTPQKKKTAGFSAHCN